MFLLEGKTAQVSGSARGLGLEIAAGLARQGARVILNGRDPQALEPAVEKVRTQDGQAEGVVFDVTQPEQVRAGLDKIGRINILVNNVGVRDRRALFEFTPDDVRRLLDDNLVAPFLVSRKVPRGANETGNDHPGKTT